MTPGPIAFKVQLAPPWSLLDWTALFLHYQLSLRIPVVSLDTLQSLSFVDTLTILNVTSSSEYRMSAFLMCTRELWMRYQSV